MQTKNGVLCVITKAEKQDLNEILALQYLCFQSEAERLNNWNIPPLTQTLEDIQHEYDQGIALKALDNHNQIIGSVRLRIADGTAYIGKLIVHPDWRRKGIATRLLQEIEHRYPCHRYELFTHTKSANNIRLYEKAGYQMFKEESISPQLPMAYLEKIRFSSTEQK